MTREKIRVLLVDDHKIVLDGVEALLMNELSIQIVGKCLNGREAVDFVEKNEIDLMVLDINMPVMDGLAVTQYIKTNQSNIKILILTMHDDSNTINQALEFGVNGYILKNNGQDELVRAIKIISLGREYFGSTVLDRIIEDWRSPISRTKLSKREKQVIRLIAKEYTTPQIAKELNLAETTVDTHRRNMISKLGIKSSLGLVRYAYENGFI